MPVHEFGAYTHWNYFLALESDLDRISRYVEFSAPNFACYSLELARTLTLACAEIDVVLRQLCEELAPESKVRNIDDMRAIVSARQPTFCQERVLIQRHRLLMMPWHDWSVGQNPAWWRAHNEVKHSRHLHFDQASLENVLNAVSALFVAVIYFYREPALKGELMPNPQYFRPSGPTSLDEAYWEGGERSFSYYTPSAAPDA